MNADIRFTFLPDQAYLDRAAKSGRSVAQEVAEAIENGEMPQRYQRNAQTLRPQDQASLARARVLLVGCGGLGGHVLEFLARAGVGTILACDPDRIELHNANRQLLATSGTLGRPKIQAACERAAEANPLVAVEPFPEGFHAGMFQGVGIVIDCLGGAAQRKELQAMAAMANIPLVSAGVSGRPLSARHGQERQGWANSWVVGKTAASSRRGFRARWSGSRRRCRQRK